MTNSEILEVKEQVKKMNNGKKDFLMLFSSGKQKMIYTEYNLRRKVYSLELFMSLKNNRTVWQYTSDLTDTEIKQQ